jgi:hypothetical protein
MSLGMWELEARSFDTGGVYSNGIGHVGVRGPVFGYRRSIYISMSLGMLELEARSFDTCGVYSNVIGHLVVRGQVFGYRRSI